MSYTAKLDRFEGPLDLLLHLIESSQLEITEINLSAVTTQYLDYVRELDEITPGELQQFLDLAARLIYIKSSALLPTLEDEEEEESLAELADQLEQYRRYSQAAGRLQDLIRSGRSYERPARQELAPDKLPLPKVDLETLAAVFQQELGKLPALPETTLEVQITLDEACAAIRIAAQRGGSLQKLIARSANRYEALVLFLAVLELIKTGEINALQDHPHGEVSLNAEVITQA